MKTPTELRRRLWLIGVCLLVIGLGLGSRSGRLPLPAFVSGYAGDTLWAVLVFLLLAIALPCKSVRWLAACALLIAFGVELLQLYQAPWLNSIRATLPGRLVLGQGFLFSDLLCYTVGVSVVATLYEAVVERSLRSLPIFAGIALVVSVLVATIACNYGAGYQVLPLVNRLPGRDKTGHFLLMGALSAAMVVMIVPRLKTDPLQGTAIVMGGVLAFVTLEEFSQYYISTRTFSMADLACSVGGVVVFGVFAHLFVRRRVDVPEGV